MDPYVILQVDRSADAEVIRAAYRVLARHHHPDMGGDPARMAEINEAWGILGNASRRARYDRADRNARAVAAAAAQAAAAEAMATGRGTPVMQPNPAATRTASRAEPVQRPASAAQTAPSWSAAPSTERTSASRGEGTVLDFGRYVGWSIGELGRYDPDYLLWLERTPAGRSLRTEIHQVLEHHGAPVATAVRPTTSTRPKRTWFR